MTEYETESQLNCLFMKHILIFKKCTWNKKKKCHATAYIPETAATLIIKKMCEEIKYLIIVGSGFGFFLCSYFQIHVELHICFFKNSLADTYEKHC